MTHSGKLRGFYNSAASIPSECVVTRPADNTSYVVTPPPINRQSDYQADYVCFLYIVRCLQETGEEQHVGYARNLRHAKELANAWSQAHPEHHSFEFHRPT